MQSCKRQFPFLDHDNNGSNDFKLHMHAAKRLCKDKTRSPTKYAVQMETREITDDSTDMDCEPCLPTSLSQNTSNIRHQNVTHCSQESASILESSKYPITQTIPHAVSNSMQTASYGINNTMRTTPCTMNNSSYIYNNNNNNNGDRYITPSEICVRCQAGEAGHYGHIGR